MKKILSIAFPLFILCFGTAANAQTTHHHGHHHTPVVQTTYFCVGNDTDHRSCITTQETVNANERRVQYSPVLRRNVHHARIHRRIVLESSLTTVDLIMLSFSDNQIDAIILNML